MTDTSLILIIFISGAVVFMLLMRASKFLEKATNFLKTFRNIVQIPFVLIGKLLMNAGTNLFDKILPDSVKDYSETKLKRWGGLGTTISFILITLTNIIVIIVALCQPGFEDKLQDFFMNTALFSFFALVEPLLDGSADLFGVGPMLEVGLTACLTMICMKKIDELGKGVQLLYLSTFTLFSSFIGFLIPNWLVKFTTNFVQAIGTSSASTFINILKLILLVIVLITAIALGLVALTEYIAMLRYSFIISGVLMIVVIIGTTLIPDIFEILTIIFFLPAVVGAEYWRFKMAEKDGI
jgi:hypothetical protein